MTNINPNVRKKIFFTVLFPANWSTRDLVNRPFWSSQKRMRCTKQKSSGHWTRGSKSQWSQRNATEASPVIAPAHCLERISRPVHRKGGPRWRKWIVRRWAKSPRKPRQLKFTKHNSREEKTGQRKNPESCRRYSSIWHTCSTESCMCVRKVLEAGERTIQQD